MIQLEIIHLRSSGGPVESLAKLISASIRDLALRLASELRACGLVEHTFWEESV
jgi:hypothetical protein